MRFLIIITVVAAALLGGAAAPANADVVSGCESGPVFGLNPGIRKICDGEIRPDGIWVRWRQFVTLDSTKSSCGGRYYQGGQCPPWMEYDFVPGGFGVPERYWLAADTIPPGEPGHLDNPIRCTDTAYRCDAP
jgi:hypothetical protein